jgi:hypothetical protein
VSNKDPELRRQYNREYYKSHPFPTDYKLQRQERALTRRKLIRKSINEYKQLHPCQECGEPRIVCLDFHHEGEKDICIADALRGGWSLNRVMEEIKKCKVLCANCHRIHHIAKCDIDD